MNIRYLGPLIPFILVNSTASSQINTAQQVVLCRHIFKNIWIVPSNFVERKLNSEVYSLSGYYHTTPYPTIRLQ